MIQGFKWVTLSGLARFLFNLDSRYAKKEDVKGALVVTGTFSAQKAFSPASGQPTFEEALAAFQAGRIVHLQGIYEDEDVDTTVTHFVADTLYAFYDVTWVS